MHFSQTFGTCSFKLDLHKFLYCNLFGIVQYYTYRTLFHRENLASLKFWNFDTLSIRQLQKLKLFFFPIKIQFQFIWTIWMNCRQKLTQLETSSVALKSRRLFRNKLFFRSECINFLNEVIQQQKKSKILILWMKSTSWGWAEPSSAPAEDR